MVGCVGIAWSCGQLSGDLFRRGVSSDQSCFVSQWIRAAISRVIATADRRNTGGSGHDACAVACGQAVSHVFRRTVLSDWTLAARNSTGALAGPACGCPGLHSEYRSHRLRHPGLVARLAEWSRLGALGSAALSISAVHRELHSRSPGPTPGRLAAPRIAHQRAGNSADAVRLPRSPARDAADRAATGGGSEAVYRRRVGTGIV